MFDQLQTMLLRSNPLPFRLHIPHRSTSGSQSEYVARVLAIQNLDVHRFSLYDGPFDIFFQLSQDATPLPALVSLNFLAEYAPDTQSAPMEFVQLFARRLVNLQHLQARWLSFSADDTPLPAMRHLTCSVLWESHYQHIFTCFPNLVDLQLNDVDDWTTLPPLSLPPSLRRIVICPVSGDALDLRYLLRELAGVPIPRLVLRGALSLDGVLPLFLASDAHQVELRLNSAGDIELTTLPADGASTRTWAITASPFCNSWRFAAHLEVPGLERLEFLIAGTQKRPLLQHGDHRFLLRAPRLKRVLFNADGNADAVRKHKHDIQRFLGALLASFRALVIYDAELLDSVTLSVPAGCALDIRCDGFAGFAKEYTVCEAA